MTCGVHGRLVYGACDNSMNRAVHCPVNGLKNKKSANHEVYFFATGIGNNEKDSVLIVEEGMDGILKFTPFSLSGNELLAIEEYDFEYWLKK